MKGRPTSRAKHPRRRARLDPATAHRETLERRWHARTTRNDQLGLQTTSRYEHPEPFHRWSNYRQGFSPTLVRTFLDALKSCLDAGPVLDPFSGTGTTIVECARRGINAVAVEAIPALNFLTNAKFAGHWPDLPNDLKLTDDWPAIADQLTQPLHRAALILAVANRHTSAGQLNKGAPPLPVAFTEIANTMSQDLTFPIATTNRVHTGDARSLSVIEDESIAAILTSPPFLSRHDYTKITRPMAEVHNHWYPDESDFSNQNNQIRAHPKAGKRDWNHQPSAAAVETINQLRDQAQPKLAGIVRSYLQDMHDVLSACCRVMMPAAQGWFIVGGARWKDIYIPADLLVAELAEEVGLECPTITVARDLVPGRRQLGGLQHVAPRESIITLKKP